MASFDNYSFINACHLQFMNCFLCFNLTGLIDFYHSNKYVTHGCLSLSRYLRMTFSQKNIRMSCYMLRNNISTTFTVIRLTEDAHREQTPYNDSSLVIALLIN